MITVEILLLAVLGGITLLAYMIAINAHGPIRLSFSYLMATMMMAATVWIVVQHVNSNDTRRHMEAVHKLEMEKRVAEGRVADQQQALDDSKRRQVISTRLNTLVTQLTGLAATIANADLRDFSADLDVLVGRSQTAQKRTEELNAELSRLKSEIGGSFSQSTSALQDVLADLTEAAKFYTLYYRSEDSAQEELRERLMRQKARSAAEKLKQTATIVASEGS